MAISRADVTDVPRFTVLAQQPRLGLQAPTVRLCGNVSPVTYTDCTFGKFGLIREAWLWIAVLWSNTGYRKPRGFL